MKTTTRTPVCVYDRNTGEPLREATPEEENDHYQAGMRDDPPLSGEDLGIPGCFVWLARLDPRLTILGWTSDDHPIFVGWKYRGWEHRSGGRRVQVAFTAAEALAYSRDSIDQDSRADGSPYGAPGARVEVDYRQDLGLPPKPILSAWRARYWNPDGTVNHQASTPVVDAPRAASK